MSEVRSFVAVPLPVGTQEAIFEAARGLGWQLPGMKWSRKASNLHITLGFLGQVDEERLSGFAVELERALMGLPGFRLGLRGFGAFPSLRQASVIWAGVDDPSGMLAHAAAEVENLARRFGFPGDSRMQERAAARSRPFRGHVTVARAARRDPRNDPRHGIDARAALAPWADHSFGEVWVNEVHLYESILGGDGSTYVLRGMATLEGATHGDVREG
jgi:2'-5' RNA ligase